MATKKTEPEASLESTDPKVPKPRLVKLIVENYRCIGSQPVEIELDDIVILVGANNVGKSSILQAYRLAMSQGSNEAKLKIDDFPKGNIDLKNLPRVEIHTVVYDETVGKTWIDESSGEKVVKERWTWSEPDTQPSREGWDVSSKQWSTKVPWGAPNYANTRRPEPHIVDAFAAPEEQAKEIVKLLKQELETRLKNHKENGDEESDYAKLLSHMGQLQKKIVKEAQQEIDAVNSELTSLVQQVFPKYKVDFDAKPEDGLDKNLVFFKSDAQLLMGPEDEHLSSVEKQGSGARRTLLWTAIKFLAENTRKLKSPTSERPHLLLIDEPEICLHPTAIRDACNALYALPDTGKWQVMATTHSPIFIDFSKDNTTIVRVEKNAQGNIQGTTVFRPNKINLGDDDKENLKLLNICDPYVAEFFFGGRIIIVEGDTEYTAFSYIRSQYIDEYRDVHIIRARGKATIVSLVKVLNHFGASYTVLHDSDKQRTQDGKKANPAWGNNNNILAAVSAHPVRSKARILASVPNFEEAYFGLTVSQEKPYKALKSLMDKANFEKIKGLLDALLDNQKALPINCIEWTKIEDLADLEATK